MLFFDGARTLKNFLLSIEYSSYITNDAIEVKNEKKMLKELESRKKSLVEQLKRLNKQNPDVELSVEDLNEKKRKTERELVEVMDRLTQLNYLLKK